MKPSDDYPDRAEDPPPRDGPSSRHVARGHVRVVVQPPLRAEDHDDVAALGVPAELAEQFWNVVRENITTRALHVVLIAIPILIQVYFNSGLAYWLNRPLKWDPVKEEIIGDPEANRWLDRPKRAAWSLS